MPRFSIEVRFKGGLTPSQQDVFAKSAARWKQVIVGDIPKTRVRGEILSALVIEAKGIRIDRGGDDTGNTLGQSAPTHFLPNGLPIKGEMEFDKFDLGEMEGDGTLESVITHEMGHVLGIGTIWTDKQLLLGAGTANPRFLGKKAGKEWTKLSNLAAKTLPVENDGGEGTEDSHWRERVFGNELMSSFITVEKQPLSRLTIASLADMGYKVSFKKADRFRLPNHLEVRTMGVGATPERVRRCTLSDRKFWKNWKPVYLPESALV